VSWGEFNRETQLHGLACTGGIISSTGVAGLTLGGGIGWLMGRFGLALDNLVQAEVVDANGVVLTASEDSHPDLFWALRGGGGNFGVVTCFEFRLHPLKPTLLGGPVIHPIHAARDMLRFYGDFVAAGLPDELVVHAGLQYHPDGSGRPVAVLFAAHSGEAAEAELASIRAFGKPLEDSVAPISYCDLNAMLDAGFPRESRDYWRSSLMRALGDEAIEALLEAFRTMPSPMSGILLEHLHGAHSRVDPTATAYPHRSDGFNVLLYGQWTDPAEDERNVGWVREQHRALARFFGAAAYSNYLASDEGEDRIRAAYGVNLDRLRSVKARYDPENVFHLNQNIPPG
jgi:FAD/FMN-containing dehydrogenase